jgi:hypothetical protein
VIPENENFAEPLSSLPLRERVAPSSEARWSRMRVATKREVAPSAAFASPWPMQASVF